MSGKLTIITGLSGSGKTTKAQQIRALDPEENTVVVEGAERNWHIIAEMLGFGHNVVAVFSASREVEHFNIRFDTHSRQHTDELTDKGANMKNETLIITAMLHSESQSLRERPVIRRLLGELAEALVAADVEVRRLGGIESFAMGESDRADVAEHFLRELGYEVRT